MSIGGTLTVSLVIVTLGGSPAAATTRDQLLDVPFVPQSEQLCGGAAVAMVMRYWGATAVHAEDFAALADRSAGGIRVGTLVRAVESRGWRALPFGGSAADVRRHLAGGRPVIALIEDRPGRYHYVVVVGWSPGGRHFSSAGPSDRIVSHDPADGPYRVMDAERFERAWAVTGRTALLVLPQAEPASVPAVVSAESSDDLRQLAGVRFTQRRWREAAALAAQAVARDGSDLPSWQLLAAARFLDGDSDGALDAWNRRGEPRVDLSQIEGLDRTRHQVVASLLNLPPQALLTEGNLRRAARRIAALPSIQMSRVRYSPRENGTANIDVAVLERTVVPKTWPSLAAASLYAATMREARLDVASPTGNGELWTAAGRWSAGRPRVSVSLATPQLWRSSGLWRIEGMWERQTYRLSPSNVAAASSDALAESDRRRAAVTFSDWATGNRRWEVSGALDHWRDRGKQFSFGAAMEERLLGDRMAVRAEGVVWPRAGKAAAFGSSTLSSAWRFPAHPAGSWTGSAAVSAVSARTPLDLWPGTDTGHVRATLLRAHPLLQDGVIRASSLGRFLLNATVEFERPMVVRPMTQLHWAAFADVAKISGMHAAGSEPFQIDLGAGLRVRMPGAPGTLRVDVARGLRDGRVALSVAWQPPWPGR
jgi:Peptidase_C39 like family